MKTFKYSVGVSDCIMINRDFDNTVNSTWKSYSAPFRSDIYAMIHLPDVSIQCIQKHAGMSDDTDQRGDVCSYSDAGAQTRYCCGIRHLCLGNLAFAQL